MLIRKIERARVNDEVQVEKTEDFKRNTNQSYPRCRQSRKIQQKYNVARLRATGIRWSKQFLKDEVNEKKYAILTEIIRAGITFCIAIF